VVPVLSRRNPEADPLAMAQNLAGVGIIAAAALLAIGVIAAVEPAFRAAQLDPQEVLRAD
jgi:ABC-type lipoprotein release transport system permease subunit